jgi:2-dehydro-3-deoxyglucarate aldolase/4-hydroxy-2-oxoheptanedioate aldolase
MKANPVRDKLRRKEAIFGTMIQDLSSPEVAAILGGSGLDFLMVDHEHSPMSYETVMRLAIAVRPTGVGFLARLSDASYTLVARMLDAGAEGVMVPRVEDRSTVEEVVAAAKYPPLGRRGFGLRGLHLGPGPVSIAEGIEHFNEHTVVIVQVETQRALDNLDEMLSVPGVDVAVVGPCDLSISLGCPGEFRHPRMEEALEHVAAVCRKKGVSSGAHFPSVELWTRWYAQGMRFVLCSTASAILRQAAADFARDLRAKLQASLSV